MNETLKKKTAFMVTQQALSVGWITHNKKFCHSQNIVSNCPIFQPPIRLRRLIAHSSCKIFSNGLFVFNSLKASFSFLIKTLAPGTIEVAFFLFPFESQRLHN